MPWLPSPLVGQFSSVSHSVPEGAQQDGTPLMHSVLLAEAPVIALPLLLTSPIPLSS